MPRVYAIIHLTVRAELNLLDSLVMVVYGKRESNVMAEISIRAGMMARD